MVVLSCQRDRARKRDLAALGLAFLTPGPTTTARTPRRLHCSSSRVYPADVRELARPARQATGPLPLKAAAPACPRPVERSPYDAYRPRLA
jgi:hypothetical protein